MRTRSVTEVDLGHVKAAWLLVINKTPAFSLHNKRKFSLQYTSGLIKC